MVMSIIWLLIFLVSLAVEFALPALVSLWFCAGSLAALILAVFIGDTLIWLQVLVFVVVTVLTLLLLRPVMFKTKTLIKTNSDSLIGKVAICEENVLKHKSGLVKIEGLTWTAVFDETQNEEIRKDDLVEITSIEGNKLLVKKYTEENK